MEKNLNLTVSHNNPVLGPARDHDYRWILNSRLSPQLTDMEAGILLRDPTRCCFIELSGKPLQEFHVSPDLKLKYKDIPECDDVCVWLTPPSSMWKRLGSKTGKALIAVKDWILYGRKK